MVPMSHMMLPTITLLGTLNIYLLFNFFFFDLYYLNLIYIKNQIVPISNLMVLTSYLMIPIEWISYPQKENGYYRMTQKSKYK